MNVVIDSNVLFSALIKDSVSRSLILRYMGCFIFPMYILDELGKHQKEIQKKSGLTKKEFDQLLEVLLSKVVVAPNEVVDKNKKKAVELVKEIDLDDAVFVATALAYPNAVLWSNDKRLKQVKQIRVLDTKEIVELLI